MMGLRPLVGLLGFEAGSADLVVWTGRAYMAGHDRPCPAGDRRTWLLCPPECGYADAAFWPGHADLCRAGLGAGAAVGRAGDCAGQLSRLHDRGADLVVAAPPPHARGLKGGRNAEAGAAGGVVGRTGRVWRAAPTAGCTGGDYWGWEGCWLEGWWHCRLSGRKSVCWDDFRRLEVALSLRSPLGAKVSPGRSTIIQFWRVLCVNFQFYRS